MDTRRVATGMLAYLIPTFAIAFIWHLHVFAAYYDTLRIYRADKIIPFGFVAILIQGTILSYVYGRCFGRAREHGGAIRFAAIAGVLSWTFTTLTVAAKHPMTSIGGFMLIETAFTLVQFSVVGPLMALAWRNAPGAPRPVDRDSAHGL